MHEPADLSKPVIGTGRNLRTPEVNEAQVLAAVADPFGHMVGQLSRADLVQMEAPEALPEALPEPPAPEPVEPRRRKSRTQAQVLAKTPGFWTMGPLSNRSIR